MLLFVQIIFGGVAYLKRDQIPRLIEQSWTTAALNDSSVVSQIESVFSCCGWKTINDSSAVPPNCALIFPSRDKPCFVAIGDSISDNLTTLGGIGVGVGIIEMLGVGFAILFAHIVKRKAERNTYFMLEEESNVTPVADQLEPK